MIEIKDLTVTFRCGRAVVDELSLAVPTGERTVVIGESGSGKSMMLAALLGILPPQADVSGSILLDGQELLGLPEKSLRALRGTRLAYIPQGSANSMNPLLRVGEQVAEPMTEKQHLPKKQALARAVEWLRTLQLGREEELARAYPHTLSGGMRQRVLIAMGAAAGADILLADEPTKGLDRLRIDQVVELLERLQGKTLLCVSHDLRFCRRVADHVCVMYAAQQVEYGDKASFYREPLHPYSRMMLEALPENGMRVTGGFAPPHEAVTGCRFAPRCPLAQDRCRQTEPPLVRVGERKVRCHRYASES